MFLLIARLINAGYLQPALRNDLTPSRPRIACAGPVAATAVQNGNGGTHVHAAARGGLPPCTISPRSMFRRRKPTIEPCLPRPAIVPPAGPDWIHEIKHDGFGILARRDESGVRLFTRNGYNFTDRFPLITKAVAALPMRS
jgi:ATP-dependent DNA ligase